MNDRKKGNLYGLTLTELRNLVKNLGEPEYRGNQLFEWMYTHRIHNLQAMTNLGQSLRDHLSNEYRIQVIDISKVDESTDGTKKYLYPISTATYVESAYIPETDRKTLCVSTQGGCKMACLFCMTARQGLQTQLSAGEILGQYAGIPESLDITHIVYMGMGEPLDNTEEVLKSIEGFTEGYGLSSKRITVSTIGILPGLSRLLEETEVNVAISLHSPFAEERKRLMPVQSVYPFESVLELLKKYDFSRRKLSFEYILFDGINDTADHAQELVRLLNPLRCRINLLHFHPIPNSPLSGTPRKRIEEFQAYLKSKGLIATVRKSRGEDIQAACGLLSTKELVRRPLAETLDY
ncbi:MAG: 23S rRNA (adenine(2503)-C(2))-methyltransferase RlmN [Spirochaetales bacterium]|nr:23S rRNA (adenine(2503)-C(2))-methyltransferase RlmN [Spirochaetales bacterium]